MPAVKTAEKKKPKPAAKPGSKPTEKSAKKIGLDDVWAIMYTIAKANEETKKQLKETQRIVGDLGNKFGDIAEQMLTPALVKKFEKMTFEFNQINRNVVIDRKELGLAFELDAILENGDSAMVVEIKSRLTKTYVDDFIETMELVRRHADFRGDKRKFYGAMGTMTLDKRVVQYALDKGLYMIMPSGEDVKISKPTSEPAVW